MQKVHFIAIGGSAMHNLAIALHDSGFEITGSDDEIFDPSKSRLEKKGLLPSKIGWFPESNIHTKLDAVIVGMHAKKENPELQKALELGLKVYAYPEYLYEQSKNKQRIVIAGSHGKTTITSMILHVLKQCRKKFDFMVGAQIEGFTNMVKLSDAPVIIIEGDEYLASPIHPRPKFMYYQHHILVLSGIAWDHINVYPSFDSYREQFELLVESSPKSGVIIYNADDKQVANLCKSIKREDLIMQDYTLHKHKVKEGITYLLHNDEKYPVSFFGDHNLYNVNAAFEVCTRLGLKAEDFYTHIQTFSGASSRLELIAKNNNTYIYKDFAHAPSKLMATTAAVAKQYPKHQLVACMELHTYSSLNKDFLAQYKNTLDIAHVPIVYYNPNTLAHKKLSPISENDIKKAFNHSKLQVFTDSHQLRNHIKNLDLHQSVLLMMSSGNFDGIHLKEFSKELLEAL